MSKILVVDDEVEVRDVIHLILERSGHRVVDARDGAEGLRKLRDEHPDLVILDMRMPVVDGWAFCRAVREDGYPRPPILVMTAAVDAKARAEEVGADGYLPKPFDIDALLESVRKLLS